MIKFNALPIRTGNFELVSNALCIFLLNITIGRALSNLSIAFVASDTKNIIAIKTTITADLRFLDCIALESVRGRLRLKHVSLAHKYMVHIKTIMKDIANITNTIVST
jgi:hypothetical protein